MALLAIAELITFTGPDIYPTTDNFTYWITTVLIVLIVYTNFLPTILPKSYSAF